MNIAQYLQDKMLKYLGKEKTQDLTPKKTPSVDMKNLKLLELMQPTKLG